MGTFIEKPDNALNTQLKTFVLKIDTHKATLGLADAEVDSIKADSKFLDYVLGGLNAYQTFAESMTEYKDLLRYGRGTDVLPAFPAIPVLGLVPPIVLANIQSRFARIIQHCVDSGNYSITIGEDLGIEAPTTPFVPGDGKPVFKIGYSSAGHPVLIWKKGKYQGVEIWKWNGTAWVKLDRDFSPDYIDKSDLPPAGQSAVWKYKMIYIYKDEVAGSFSDEVVVTVYGNV
ncbi:MAG TPA: hypothetical protein VI757_14540 [Bacteroidia bacterium]|nr:hypothetical protein [Bacteroidia bacterium]